MAERRSPARIDRELSQSLLAVGVLAGLALLAWAVAGLAPAVNNAVRPVFDRDDVVTVRFEAVNLGEDWGHGDNRRALPYRAFSVFDATDTDGLRQYFGIGQAAWRDVFVGVAKIKSRAVLVALADSNGKASARLQEGDYLVCVSHPFPNENDLAACRDFEFASDTTVSVESGMGGLVIWEGS